MEMGAVLTDQEEKELKKCMVDFCHAQWNDGV